MQLAWNFETYLVSCKYHMIVYRYIDWTEYNWNATSNRKFEANLKASPSLFTHMKRAQSVNYDMNTRVWGSIFGFKKKISSLSEGSVPVISFRWQSLNLVPRASRLTKSPTLDSPHSLFTFIVLSLTQPDNAQHQRPKAWHLRKCDWGRVCFYHIIAWRFPCDILHTSQKYIGLEKLRLPIYSQLFWSTYLLKFALTGCFINFQKLKNRVVLSNRVRCVWTLIQIFVYILS
jgi:hypothetical protein